jgi:transmembrane protein 132
LKYVSRDDYYLDISTSYHHLVGLVEDSKPFQPRIVALKEGRGELFKILFKLGKKCRKKKTLPLQTDIVMINADFSLPNTINNDHYLSDWPDHNNHASERRDKKQPDKPHYSFKSQPKEDPYHYKDTNSKSLNKFSKVNPSDTQLYGVDYNLHENLKKAAHDYNINENLKQSGHSYRNRAVSSNEPEKKPAEVPGLSPLEIGMYVLLAVFCVGLSVFFINCVVFMYRHKKKQAAKGNKGGTVAQVNDWVWIGRATLERNAINTQCSQTLMPINDFNGNQANSSVPVDSGIHSAQSSNRSSFVSTIKGSECSIRITANPLPEDNPADNNNLSREPEWDYEAMGMTYEQLAEYFDNLKESTA